MRVRWIVWLGLACFASLNHGRWEVYIVPFEYVIEFWKIVHAADELVMSCSFALSEHVPCVIGHREHSAHLVHEIVQDEYIIRVKEGLRPSFGPHVLDGIPSHLVVRIEPFCDQGNIFCVDEVWRPTWYCPA